MFNRHRTLGRLAWRINETASRRYAPRLINDPPFESCLLTGAVCLLSFAFAFSRVSTKQMFRNMSACARESRPIRENREAARAKRFALQTRRHSLTAAVAQYVFRTSGA